MSDLSTITSEELLRELMSRFESVVVICEQGTPDESEATNVLCKTNNPYHVAGHLLRIANKLVNYMPLVDGNNFNPGEKGLSTDD